MPRKPGSLNKITKETRALLAGILEGEIQNIPKALAVLKDGKEEQYLQAVARFLPYIVPKAQETLGIDLNSVSPPIWFDGTAKEDCNA